jgi:hypothetical protein
VGADTGDDAVVDVVVDDEVGAAAATVAAEGSEQARSPATPQTLRRKDFLIV